MARIGPADTVPELAVRRALHRLGYRFRTNHPGLPGRPDLVFPKRECVIFVHGCFWHGHRCSHGRIRPKTNTAFWIDKIATNKKRDARQRTKLRRLGWRVLEVSQCQIRKGTWLPKAVCFLEQ
jgi:DNA mismatch endonuclease (patch repair protein)